MIIAYGQNEQSQTAWTVEAENGAVILRLIENGVCVQVKQIGNSDKYHINSKAWNDYTQTSR